MIVTNNQPYLIRWLCNRIGLEPSANICCIGNEFDGKLRGVVGYDGYNGASIQMHVAGEGNWFSKDLLFAVFDYPFNVCQVNMVLGMVPSGNADAIRFNTHIGFKVEKVIPGAHPDGALWIMSMRREECRFLNRTRGHHGQEVKAAAGT